ncbi:phosphohistidine phosphatase SixA [Rodentibacter trehalosifermentans]|uniref:Phosphohistidine phosphatase SixA n=1 Tax=Rodentibacter trehalosifermentans TaxID=1908263 RepID=A0A1V3J109_9PAST|nr:phosphohistidine phosphatase SixA [Rodentibacter trehalosifermentans]OOF48602.1 phosphohistidine phosphatase SixA [Rodentibacter trehalosifermentans]
MNIFVMRHGEAEVMAKTDKERHLTDYGKKQAFAQGEWLKNYIKSTALSFDLVLVSPYQRALETFEEVDVAFDSALKNKQEIWDGITPYGSAELVVNYLSVLENEGVGSVLLISHLPLVGEIVAELYGKRNPVSFYPATLVQVDWKMGKGEILTHHYPLEML